MPAELKRNISLKKYTTFRVGGPAKYFFAAKTEEGLIRAITTAEKIKLPFFILGRGSNVLAGDEGYGGMVIQIENSNLKIQNYNSKFKIFCGAGANLSELVFTSLKAKATGMEWAAGIPGTLGGAIYGNAGAFGESMKKVVKEVRVLEVKPVRPNKPQAPNFKTGVLKNKDCKFGYRESIFKRKKNLIIISAELELKKRASP